MAAIAVVGGGLLLPASYAQTFYPTRAHQTRAQVAVDPDAYAVYSAVLPQMWPWAQLDAMNLVILAKTKAHVVCTPQGSSTGGDGSNDAQSSNGDSTQTASNTSDQSSTEAAFAQYDAVNKQTWLLQRKLQISRSYTLVGPGEVENISRREIGAWDLFFERHADSGGYIQFSGVGFSPDKKTAVVYAEYACGPQCGDGALYLLHKQGTQWVLGDPPANSCNGKKKVLQETGM
jgi:hypothetical protein